MNCPAKVGRPSQTGRSFASKLLVQDRSNPNPNLAVIPALIASYSNPILELTLVLTVITRSFRTGKSCYQFTTAFCDLPNTIFN